MFKILLFTTTLVAIAALTNSIMDTLRYRYDGSLFESLARKRTSFGRFMKAWAGPEAHLNKFWLDGHPIWGPIFGWLFHGPLVFLTSLWHFSKFVMLSSFQLAIIGNLYFLEKVSFQQGIWYFLSLKLVFGLVFELFFPSYENERREWWEARQGAWSRSFAFRSPSKGIQQVILLSSFILGVVIHQVLGGNVNGVFGWAELMAMGAMAVGWVFVWLIQSREVGRMMV